MQAETIEGICHPELGSGLLKATQQVSDTGVEATQQVSDTGGIQPQISDSGPKYFLVSILQLPPVNRLAFSVILKLNACLTWQF